MSMEVVERNWYRADQKPEQHVQTITMFYYGNGESDEAKRLTKIEADAKRKGMTRDASTFCEVEPCVRVVILPGVTGHHRAKIVAAYGDLVDRVSPPVGEQAAAVQSGETVLTPERTAVDSTPAAASESPTQSEPVRESARRGRQQGRSLV